MQRVVRGFVLVLMAVALPVFAATPSEFYLTMLQKGVTAYDAGRFDAASTPLRIAAFGLVDSVEQYQLAQIYLTLTYDRLGDTELARRAARSVVIAERIESRYPSLQLATATRSGFETIAKRLLTPADFATFERRAAAQNTTTTPPRTVPQTTTQTTTTTTTPPVQTPTQTTQAKPQPTPAKPNVEAPKPQQSATNNTTKPPATITAKPAEPKPAPAKPAPTTTTTTTTPVKPPYNAGARFIAAEQALTAARLTDARAIYREILEQPSLQRDEMLRLAEGFYRARDFAHALRAFDRLGALRRGEEPYRYYIAVAYYETGQYPRARQELTAVLPYIEITPDVARYRTKIEGAVN